eukprot:4627680-Pleurochrysis_carterae.AAC.1
MACSMLQLVDKHSLACSVGLDHADGRADVAQIVSSVDNAGTFARKHGNRSSANQTTGKICASMKAKSRNGYRTRSTSCHRKMSENSREKLVFKKGSYGLQVQLM